MGELRSVLKEPEVKRLCLDAIADIGCRPPSNHLVLFCLDKALLGTTTFLGKAAASRLEEIIVRIGPLGKLFDRIAGLNREASDRNALKAKLLAGLRDGSEPAPGPSIDEATSLEVLSALHQGKALAGLDERLTSVFAELQQDIGRYFADFHQPELGWNMQTGDDMTATDAIKYNSGAYTFVGRDEEIDLLTQFLGDMTVPGMKNAFQWLLVTGAGGEGKTRLALEFSNGIRDRWSAGALSMADMQKFHAAKWRPRHPTFMVVDYPARAPTEVHELMLSLQRNAAEDEFDFPVRLLLLEREAEGEWYRRLLPEGSGTSAVLGHCFRRDRFEQGFELLPIPPDAVAQMMRERFEAAGLSPPDNDELIAAASRVDPRSFEHEGNRVPLPRPLFAAAVSEVLVEALRDGEEAYQATLETLGRKDVLTAIVRSERERRWQHTDAGKNGGALDAHETLLAVATICLGIDRGRLDAETPRSAGKLLPEFGGSRISLDRALLQAMGSPTLGHFEPLEPDILGEHFVLETVKRLRQDGHDPQPLYDLAFAIGGDDTAVFVLRCLRDFPDDIAGLGFLAPTQAPGERAATVYSRLSVDLVVSLGERDAWDLIDFVFSRLDALRAPFPDHAEIALREANAAVNVTNFAGEAGDWTRIEAMFGRLDALRAAFPDHAEIALQETMATVNFTNLAGEAGDWTRIEATFDRLDALRAAFPDHAEIALHEAMAAFNVTNFAGEAGDWTRIEAMFGRLDALRAAFPDHAEIALHEAKAAFNVTNFAGEAGDWTRIEAMFGRLDALRAAFPDHAEIALREAIAAFNVTNLAGEAGDWTRIEAMFGRLDALRAAFPDHAEIALRESMATVNVTNLAGEAGDWTRIEAMFGRLDALRAAFPDHAEIALHESMATVNVTNLAGKAGDWTRIEAMFGILAALASTFTDNNELIAVVAAGSVARHQWKRRAGLEPDLDETQEAVASAKLCIVTFSADEPTFFIDASLQAIKDARRRFSDDPVIAEIHYWAVAAGMDFDKVPDINATD